jgi:hypothetical protein
MAWFHGKITRELAEELLQPRTEGLYLIRESTNFSGDYTLSVVANRLVDHYRIITRGGRISIDEEEFFDSLEQLIAHYEKDADGLSTKLVRSRAYYDEGYTVYINPDHVCRSSPSSSRAAVNLWTRRCLASGKSTLAI